MVKFFQKSWVFKNLVEISLWNNDRQRSRNHQWTGVHFKGTVSSEIFHKPSKFYITIVTFNYITTVIMGVFRYFLVKIQFVDHRGIIQ